jgi:peptidoglycan/xylan/chitin deacetylase (PgdA/CDA1 family)
MSQVRNSVKHMVEQALLAGGATAAHRWLRRITGESVVLAYHNVVADEVERGDASLHLPLSAFREQLDAIRRAASVVPLETISERGRGSKPRVAITFDDAYTGAMTLAARELEDREMPFTVFVAPGLLGETPWWDILARDLPGGLTSPTREACLTELRGEGVTILRHHGLETAAPEADARRIATESELARVAQCRGATFASHTWSHLNLARADLATVTAELRESKAWLEQRFSNALPMLSYPYGLYTPAVAEVAASAGFVRCFRVDGAWGRPTSGNSRAYPRLNVPAGVSVAGFRLRCAL